MFHGFKFALKMIKKRPLRMSLTLLQVACGVASIIIVLSLVFSIIGDGAEEEQKLTIQAGSQVIKDNNSYRSMISAFDDKMLKAFQNETNYLENLSVLVTSHQGMIEYDSLAYLYQRMSGVSPIYQKMIDLEMVAGYFFTQADIDDENKVIVISEEANQQLFGTESGIGQTVRHSVSVEETERIEEWKIIGIYLRPDQSNNFSGFPHFIVPYSQIARDSYPTLVATVKPGKLAEAKSELEMIFKHQYLEKPQYLEQAKEEVAGESETPGLLFMEDGIDNLQETRKMVGKSFGLFIGSFAFVAVVVSSIGILSMMLVSIVERTREVGLRRSLGASSLQIMGQILAESVMLSFIGGVAGVCLSFVLIKPILHDFIYQTSFLRYLGVEATISIYPILISLGSILIIGLLAGLYPGFQASRIMPVEAIREN